VSATSPGRSTSRAPSLYAHVASKEDLLWSIAVQAADRFANAQRLAEAPGPPADRLKALITAHVAIVTAEPAQAAVFLQEWRHLGPERRAEMGRRRDAYEHAIRALLSDGIARRTFRPVDATVAAAAVLSALNGLAAWYRSDGPIRPDELAATIADLFLAGLRA
jgi:AcrR family transcriptional regulator